MSSIDDRYKEWKKKKNARSEGESTDSSSQTASVDDRYKAWRAQRLDLEGIANSIADRTSTWLKNHNNYLSNYNNRFSGRKGTYEDSYVADSGDWLSTVSQQRENFEKEANSILSMLDKYGDYLDPKWTSSIRDALTSAGTQQADILKYATGDSDYWSQFASEDEYGLWQTDQGYRSKYSGQSYDDIMATIGQLADGEEKQWLSSYRYEALKQADDFAQHSQYANDSKGFTKYFSDPTYEYINGKLAFAFYDKLAGVGANYNYDQMNEDEVAIYNYFYAKEGKEKAEEYLNSLHDTLVARGKQEIQEDFAAFADKVPVISSVASIPLSLLSGYENAENAIKYFAEKAVTGEAKLDPSYTALASNTIRGTVADKIDWEIGNWDAGAFLYNTAMSGADSLTAGLVFGDFGGAVLGLSAAAQGTNDALERGMSDGQAFWNGLVAGTFEGLFETVSIGNLNKLKEVAPDSVRDIIKNLGKSMLVNASEETLTELANITYDTLINGDFANYTWEELKNGAWKKALAQVLEAGASGALMGVGMGIVGNTIGYYKGGQEAKQTYGSDPGALVGEALEIDPGNTFAQKMQGRLDSGKKLSGGQLMRLNNQIVESDMQTIQSTAAQTLRKLGETGNVDTVAAALAKQAAGEELSLSEKRAIKNSKYGQRVANEMDPENIRKGGYASEWAEKMGTRRINAQEYSRMLEAAQQAQETAETTGGQAVIETQNEAQAQQVESGAVVAENATTTKSVSKDGVTRQVSTGKEVTPKKIVSISGGNVMIETDSGRVSADDIEFDTMENDLLWRSAVQFNGITASGANGIVRAYRNGESVTSYLAGAGQEFRNGYYNLPSGGEMANKLTSAQREIIYELGQKAAGENTAKAQAKATAAKKSSETVSKTEKVGKVHFERNGRTFDGVRETALKTMEQLSAALGVEFYVFESYKNEAGKLVYKDANGNEVPAPNGYYDPKDGRIYIDLNAGVDGKGTMLFTVAHELTHFINQWSPAKFKVLANVLMKQYAEKNISVDDLVNNQIKKAKKNGRELTWDEAYEEVVADSMEAMLTDGNVVQLMADLKQQDKTLWQKICDWFKDLVADLKAVVDAYKGYKPDSNEGRMVAQMQDVIVMLESFYADALLDAGENYQAAAEAQKNTTQEGDVKMQLRSADGNPVVWISEDIMQENDGKPVHQFIAEYIADHIGDVYTIIESGQKVYIGEDLPGEYTQSKYTKAILKKKPNILKAKNRATANLGEMIEIATNRRWEKTKHPDSNDAKYGMYRYDTRFGFPVRNHRGENIGANVYRAELLIRNASDGKKYLYDVVSIKKDIASSDWLTQRVTSAAGKPAGQKGDVSSNNVAQDAGNVKEKSTEAMEIVVDEKTESLAPGVLFSERTWTESDYVQERDKAAKEIANAIGVSEKKAMAYIDSVNSIAKMIADDRVRLDYFSSPGRSSFVSNVEYGGSFDFSTLCKKRRLLTGTFTAIQNALPNTALTADEILDIRNRMKEAGLEVSCGLCYVEGSRGNMGQFAKEFLKLYQQYYPDAWQPNMADVNTPDGIEWVRINHPECYEQYEYFWNHYGTLKDADKNLFASQQKPKLYQLHTEYKGEILDQFHDDENVEEKNLNGGIRLQSFSDFEIVHLIDTMQIIMDMSRVGLAGQAYTKVPDFAWALGDTGMKINLSLIAKDVDENGRLVFDDVEGMPISEAMKLRDRYSENVGTILVAFNDGQLLAAMADDRVDFIIPFHRSQWKKSQYEAMGLPANTKDYTYMQNEKFIKPQYHEYRGRMVKDRASNYMPNEYWDFSKSGKENAEAYLEMCARNNKRPKFYKLLQNNGDGSYSLKADGSTDGYWKLLIDFKMYDNNGVGSPQVSVKPEFNMDEATRMLNEYSGGHSNFPVAQGIVDSFVKEYKESHKGQKFSERDPELEKVNQVLEKENAQLKHDVAYLKELLKLQNQVTGGTKFTETSVEAAAGQLMKHADAKGDRKELAGLLNGLYEYIAGSKEPTWDGVVEAAQPAVEWLKSHVRTRTERSAYAKDVLKEIQNSRIYLDEQQKKEVAYQYGSYNEFRKKTMGSVILTDTATMSLDSQWHEWAAKYPNLFDPDITSTNMPAALMEVFDSLRNMTATDSYGYDQELLGQELLSRVYDSYWNVSTLYTVKDKAQKEINKLKFDHAGRMATLREYHKEQTAKLKTEHREALQKVKQAERERSEKKLQEISERYQESRQKGIENRRKTEMRRKIRRTIMDLNKILNRGDKKRNVKEDMKDLVSKALKTADILFTDNYMAEDMVRNGVGTELTEQEAKYLTEAQSILAEIEGAGTLQDRQEAENRLQGKLDYRMSKLKDVFAREKARLNKTKVSEVLGDLADAYASLEDSEYSYVSGAFDENVHQYLTMLKADVGGTIVKDMSLNQLDELHKAYTMVLTTVRNANKMFAANLKQTREQLGSQVIGEVKQAGGEHGLWLPGEDKLNAFSWNNQKPVYAFERIGSATLTKLFENTRAGEDSWAQDMTEAREYYLAQTKKHHYDSWNFEKQFKFTSTSGIDFSLNLEQIMSLYAYSKREQAHDHLLKGGFVFDGNTEVQVNKMGIKVTYLNKTAKAHNISPEIMGQIISKLTAEQKAFVDEMQDYLSTTMGEKGNEVSMQMYGVKLFNEKHYFPLRSAGQYMARAKEADLKKQQGQISIVNSGFTKATTPKSSNPVVLSGFMDVWADHVNEMSMYHSFVLPMEDFRRVYNYSSPNMETGQSVSVNSVIQEAYGEAATGYIDQLYRDLNGGAVSDPRENGIKALVGKFKKAAVFASLSVVIQQPSAIGRAFAIIDPKYFIGSKVDNKRHKALWAELKKYAPVAAIKEMGYFDTGMGKSAQDFIKGKEYNTLKEKAAAIFTDKDYRDEVLSKAPALADELTWCAIWEAAKRETKANNPKMDVKSEEFLQLAGKRFTEVITKTQVYDSVLSRSANMRSKGVFMSMWTAFMAEPTTTINMVEDALRKAKRGNKKYAAKAIGAVTTSIVLNALLSSLVYAIRDDDEDETFLEKYVQSFATEILDGINPLTYYPFLKDIWSSLQGFDIERSDMSLITSLVEKITKLVQVYAKDAEDRNDGDLANAWWGVADYVAAIAGVPVKNVRREINGAINTYKTVSQDLTDRDTTWGSLVDKTWDSVKNSLPVVGWLPDETAADKLYKATVSGDTAYQKRLSSAYDTQEKLDNAIRKGLRANDSRIWEAAMAWNNNDLASYMRIAKEIIGEGHFSQDNVVMAIQAEAKAMLPKESDSESKYKGYFTADKFAVAISQGNDTMAAIIKADIIETAQKNGKTAEEAEDSFTSSAKSSIKKLFQNGGMTGTQAANALVDYFGISEEDAAEDVQYWTFQNKYPEYDMSESAVTRYYEYAEPAGIDVSVYYDYYTQASKCESDLDKNGNAISGSKKAKILDVIDSMELTKAQKDALYYANGWAKSTIYEAPWR